MAEAFVWGPGGKRISATQAATNRKTAEALANRVQNPKTYWEGIQSAVGDIGGSLLNWQADQAQEAGREEVAQALAAAQAGGDPSAYMTILGNEWASPSQSAVASALLNRGWSAEDRQANWDREDRIRAEEAARPKYDTFEGAGGDLFRVDVNNPDADPSLLYDAPDPPREAPKIEEAFDPETGRPTKQQWSGEEWQPFGGVAAPKEPLVNLDMTGGADAEFYKAGDKARGEQFTAVETAGYQATTKLSQIQRLSELLATAPQGATGGFVQAAGELGIPIDGLDEVQAAQALINKMVPEQRTPGSGPMSDADLALFKQSMPRIINQPGGNQLIIATLSGIAAYEQQMGQIASRVLNREITPAEGRAQMAMVGNPLDAFKQQVGGGDDAPWTDLGNGIRIRAK